MSRPRPRVHAASWALIVLAALVGLVFTVRGETVLAPALAIVAIANVFAIDALRWPSRHEFGTTLLLYEASAVMLCWLFPPHGIWLVAFVCLTPWAIATVRTQRAWLVHWLSFAVGWAFFLVGLRWLQPVTGLGYSALAFYLALYWTLAAWAIRTARRHGISPIWSLPVTWIACEYLRATVMTGFPWLFLSHGLYEQLPLIQIADLTGAYGVSFVAALVNGTLTELALWRWPVPGPGPKRAPRQLAIGVPFTVVVLIATLIYGQQRLGDVSFASDPNRHGPRLAVIQEDFPLVSTPPYGEHSAVIFSRYLALAAQAAAEDPDLIVFPETAWNAYQNIDYIETPDTIPEARPELRPYSLRCHEAVSAFARGDYPAANAVISELEAFLRVQADAQPEMGYPRELPRLPAEAGNPVTTLVGAVSIEQFPKATYPKVKFFNSALIYDEDGTQRRQRYDKRHLVPFGEVVPFRQARFLGLDLHWLYRQLNALSPFSAGGRIEYSLTPGDEFTVFTLESDDDTYHFGVPICYEDVMPYVPRRFVWHNGQRRADFLINISNDGWFQHSNELPQHLAICAFRAVENRVSIARAVNTGISGFIDPDGRIYSVVSSAGRSFGPGVIGYDIETVYLDNRSSLYGRTGDWFAGACVLLAAVLWLSAIFERWVLALRQRLSSWLRRGGA